MIGLQHDTPSPQLVRYNDWRQVAVAAPGAFTPELPLSVIVPYYAQSEEFGRTLAAHARWHHAVPDAVTLGLRLRVPVDGVDAEMIQSRPGTLKKLFKGRKAYWFDGRRLHSTVDLT